MPPCSTDTPPCQQDEVKRDAELTTLEEEEDDWKENGVEKKYKTYNLRVDPLQDDRACEIKLCSFARPHMRAFHFAWWCYHVAFLMWFSITPLLTEVQQTLNLTKEQVWTSSISAVSGTVVMRFILGPFCDKYGPRIPMAIILIAAGIPTGLTGLVKSATGLTVIRFFIGVGGSTFVMCQYWTSRMFTRELVGTANATVAGWGNLGGGIAQILMGSILFPMFRTIFDGSEEKAWRTACVVPAFMGLITGLCVVLCTDDAPTGNYSKLKKQHQMSNVSVVDSFRSGSLNINTWLLFIQYACCFGVEITMNNAAALYFKEQFDMTTESAAAIASIFGWMNLFARGLGGFISDKANSKFGMRGRIMWQTACLLIEGTMIIIFAHSTRLASAIAVLVFFSIFVQAAEGSSYGIVPYINPTITGSISGIVGAGGNVGAVAFGFCFQQLSSKMAFVTMGIIIICSSVLSLFVWIDGHSSLVSSRSTEEKDSIQLDTDAESDDVEAAAGVSSQNRNETSEISDDQNEPMTQIDTTLSYDTQKKVSC